MPNINFELIKISSLHFTIMARQTRGKKAQRLRLCCWLYEKLHSALFNEFLCIYGNIMINKFLVRMDNCFAITKAK